MISTFSIFDLCFRDHKGCILKIPLQLFQQLRVLVDYYRAGVVPGAVAGYLPPALRADFLLFLTNEITTFSIFRFEALTKLLIFPRKYQQLENQRFCGISQNAIKTNENA